MALLIKVKQNLLTTLSKWIDCIYSIFLLKSRSFENLKTLKAALHVDTGEINKLIFLKSTRKHNIIEFYVVLQSYIHAAFRHLCAKHSSTH